MLISVPLDLSKALASNRLLMMLVNY